MNEIKNIKVHRTTEGTIFEVLAAILIIAMWIVTLTSLNASGADIGSPSSATDDTTSSIIRAICGTVATALCLIGAYYPSRMIHTMTKPRNLAQYAMIVRMARVLALEVALIFLILAFKTKFSVESPRTIMTVVLIATLLVFEILIYRRR